MNLKPLVVILKTALEKMKNKKEQTFCTKLGVWLKTTNHPQSMLIECKVSETFGFDTKKIRASQLGVMRRLLYGLPIVHKISDSSVGSKLVDMIYISHKNTKIKPYVAVYFVQTKEAYLIPWSDIEMSVGMTVGLSEIKNHKIW